MELITTDAAQTRAVGQKLAECAMAGAVLWLRGDLGAGKTELTNGVAAGLCCADPVSSPSFALIHEYTGGRLPLYHIDLYRLEGSAAEELGVEDYLEGDGLTVIEWGERLPPDYFPDGVDILLEYLGETDERKLTITPRGKCGEEWMRAAWGR